MTSFNAEINFNNPYHDFNGNFVVGVLPVSLGGISSAEELSSLSINTYYQVSLQGIESAESLGLLDFIVNEVYLILQGIESAESLGVLFVIYPGTSWVDGGGFSMSLRLAPPYSMKLKDTHGDLRIITNR